MDRPSFSLHGVVKAHMLKLGETFTLTCTVVSRTVPIITWSKRSYEGYEVRNVSAGYQEFSSSGFGWKFDYIFQNFNYTDSGNYTCSARVGNQLVTF